MELPTTDLDEQEARAAESGSLGALVRLAAPTVLSYLAVMLLGAVDLVFAGRHSAVAVGAVGMGNAAFSWVMVTGIGLLAGLDYLVSHARGAGERERGYRAWVQSHWLVLALSVLGMPLLYVVAANLELLGVHESLIPDTAAYIRVVAPGLPMILVFQAAWQYLRGHGVVNPPLYILLGMNVLNFFGNWALVLGEWGFPRLGAEGAAWMTLLARGVGALAIGVVLWRHDARTDRFFGRAAGPRWEPGEVRRLLELGLPAAGQMALEVGVFASATALAARWSAEALAAHQIALNLASLTFMVPLGVGAAAAVTVGHSLGSGRPRAAAAAGWRALGLGMAFMAFSALAFFFVPAALLRLYTDDAAVVAAGLVVLRIAAIFQLADGAQVVLTGALRGWADTRSPMIANLVGHWLIGLPLGVYLGFSRGLGLGGLWTGLAIGLLLVALALVWRWRRRAAVG